MTRLTVDLDTEKTTVTLPGDQGTVTLSAAPLPAPEHGVQLPIVGGRLNSETVATADEYLTITLPANQAAGLADYFDLLIRLLTRLGIQSGQTVPAPAKKKAAKARHRFDKALADRPFHVARHGSTATVYWTGRNEMTVKAGAVLAQEQLINRDGSLRYSTKYGEKLRADHAAAITDGQTIADIHLRSVNEVGLFLYFGDTNGWLELVDDGGHTLDALTKVD
ncbi:hypothetical protein [Schleiferilactobacillus harbinensis]|jgi:hypothetical protein|uniref:hypothetical protein n=1 Tax=Schleiferilactobacillus harbinensis TaxID=304207 RepID=UPI0026732210|nr:hypothetical protein [Schleiferilactobacillus harbinensis]